MKQISLKSIKKNVISRKRVNLMAYRKFNKYSDLASYLFYFYNIYFIHYITRFNYST